MASGVDQLADIFGNLTTTATQNGLFNGDLIFNRTDYLKLILFVKNYFNKIILRFVTKQSGVFYEDEIIQVGCKLETRSNLARLGMFYGDKTGFKLAQFQTSILCLGNQL